MIRVEGYTLRKCVQETLRAELHAATRDRDGAEVLLKSYRADGARDPQARVQREFDALRKVEGPGVVRALDLQLTSAPPVLVLELVAGLNLKHLLESRPLDPTSWLEIAIALAAALTRVHAARLIHRDIKPSNVMVEPRSLRTTIVDFGMALPFGAPGSTSDVVLATDGFAGTLLYVAPEQTGRMNRGIDFRSDLYSLGATLYHALAGVPPFGGGDALSLIHAHMARLPDSPLEHRPELPATLARIVLKLLQKEPEDRYQTAHALHRDLLESRAQLLRTGHIDDEFPLATADAPFRPLFAKRLYGRDAEIALLQASYERAALGAPELVLLRGPPGIGKSALVDELRGALARTRGYLACGKFDLYRRSLPYAGFIAAFESLVEQLLTESEELLAQRRERLRAVLGNVAAVLVELVPDLGAILGQVAPAPQLGPKETQARLATAVERFVRGCATPEHPLVLFLDDLQWADPGSRDLLEALLIQGQAPALLVVGAYRDTEVDPTHPLAELLLRLERVGVRSTPIEVGPIGLDAAAGMLADALGRTLEETRYLAQTVALKTGNTPLLIQQFILHVHGLGLIQFVPPRGWTWDDAKLAAADIPEGAVGLMVAKLERLADKPRELIRFASCVGDEFDSRLLSELTDEPVSALEPALFTLAEEGLLAPSASGFRFVHDRVREAAQALIRPEQRSLLHYRVARLLIARTPADGLAERALEIADHLNRGLDHLSESERPQAMSINLVAGRRALAAGVGSTAASYLGFARALLRESDWEIHRPLVFGVLWESAEAAFQSKAFELALRLLEQIEAKPLAVLELAQVLAKRVAIVTFTRDGDALGLTLEALSRFGVRWRRRPSRLGTRLEILRTDWMLRGPLDARLFPRRAGPPGAWLAPVIIASAGGAALVRESNALVCFVAGAALRAQRRHGLVRPPGLALAAYAAFRTAALGSPRGVARYAQAAEDWVERMPSAVIDPRVLFELQAYVYPWLRPRRKQLEPLRRACDALLDVGDLEYFTYASRNRGVYQALCGEPLGECLRTFEAMHQRERMQNVSYGFAGYIKAYRLLHGSKPGASPEPGEATPSWSSELESVEQLLRESRDAAVYIWIHWVVALCFLRQWSAAAGLADKISDTVYSVGGFGSTVVDFSLFRGLAAALLAPLARGSERKRCVRVLAASARRLRGWASQNPDFAHMSIFLEAERARLAGDTARALHGYAGAIRRASEQGYRHHTALLHERRADLLLDKRRESEARGALRDARVHYGDWGAHAKLLELEQRERTLRDTSRGR